ncbi:hypothetical protein P152DRAFT_16917 [Eremomyces bilateralis CBS 781.70]|uniref:Shelterin complex subunit TPP1/Est3 domain-containing protein n=1 Tax=Eremomyces bilateralis CBS 781.70 TaxID=1392243 RepID=A0A6G1GH90_9PEZI|nr:uncharacterized protein P152DRAFT_16917 [Eremomyces bilateralis CBS 781.70]KAF1817374.1 hypothetical protein P152DRAFT_16917 [Eremomyces bilateralis CBS 781.70]
MSESGHLRKPWLRKVVSDELGNASIWLRQPPSTSQSSQTAEKLYDDNNNYLRVTVSTGILASRIVQIHKVVNQGRSLKAKLSDGDHWVSAKFSQDCITRWTSLHNRPFSDTTWKGYINLKALDIRSSKLVSGTDQISLFVKDFEWVSSSEHLHGSPVYIGEDREIKEKLQRMEDPYSLMSELSPEHGEGAGEDAMADDEGSPGPIVGTRVKHKPKSRSPSMSADAPVMETQISNMMTQLPPRSPEFRPIVLSRPPKNAVTKADQLLQLLKPRLQRARTPELPAARERSYDSLYDDSDEGDRHRGSNAGSPVHVAPDPANSDASSDVHRGANQSGTAPVSELEPEIMALVEEIDNEHNSSNAEVMDVDGDRLPDPGTSTQENSRTRPSSAPLTGTSCKTPRNETKDESSSEDQLKQVNPDPNTSRQEQLQPFSVPLTRMLCGTPRKEMKRKRSADDDEPRRAKRASIEQKQERKHFNVPLTRRICLVPKDQDKLLIEEASWLRNPGNFNRMSVPDAVILAMEGRGNETTVTKHPPNNELSNQLRNGHDARNGATSGPPPHETQPVTQDSTTTTSSELESETDTEEDVIRENAEKADGPPPSSAYSWTPSPTPKKRNALPPDSSVPAIEPEDTTGGEAMPDARSIVNVPGTPNRQYCRGSVDEIDNSPLMVVVTPSKQLQSDSISDDEHECAPSNRGSSRMADELSSSDIMDIYGPGEPFGYDGAAVSKGHDSMVASTFLSDMEISIPRPLVKEKAGPVLKTVPESSHKSSPTVMVRGTPMSSAEEAAEEQLRSGQSTKKLEVRKFLPRDHAFISLESQQQEAIDHQLRDGGHNDVADDSNVIPNSDHAEHVPSSHPHLTQPPTISYIPKVTRSSIEGRMATVAPRASSEKSPQPRAAKIRVGPPEMHPENQAYVSRSASPGTPPPNINGRFSRPSPGSARNPLISRGFGGSLLKPRPSGPAPILVQQTAEEDLPEPPAGVRCSPDIVAETIRSRRTEFVLTSSPPSTARSSVSTSPRPQEVAPRLSTPAPMLAEQAGKDDRSESPARPRYTPYVVGDKGQPNTMKSNRILTPPSVPRQPSVSPGQKGEEDRHRPRSRLRYGSDVVVGKRQPNPMGFGRISTPPSVARQSSISTEQKRGEDHHPSPSRLWSGPAARIGKIQSNNAERLYTSTPPSLPRQSPMSTSLPKRSSATKSSPFQLPMSQPVESVDLVSESPTPEPCKPKSKPSVEVDLISKSPTPEPSKAKPKPQSKSIDLISKSATSDPSTPESKPPPKSIDLTTATRESIRADFCRAYPASTTLLKSSEFNRICDIIHTRISPAEFPPELYDSIVLANKGYKKYSDACIAKSTPPEHLLSYLRRIELKPVRPENPVIIGIPNNDGNGSGWTDTDMAAQTGVLTPEVIAHMAALKATATLKAKNKRESSMSAASSRRGSTVMNATPQRGTMPRISSNLSGTKRVRDSAETPGGTPSGAKKRKIIEKGRGSPAAIGALNPGKKRDDKSVERSVERREKPTVRMMHSGGQASGSSSSTRHTVTRPHARGPGAEASRARLFSEAPRGSMLGLVADYMNSEPVRGKVKGDAKAEGTKVDVLGWKI